MKNKYAWKRISAWVLTAAMVTSSSSFAALAEETVQEPITQEAEASETEVPETVESAPQEEVQPAEVLTEAPQTEAPTEDVSETENTVEVSSEQPTEAEETTEPVSETEAMSVVSDEAEVIISEAPKAISMETEEVTETALLAEEENVAYSCVLDNQAKIAVNSEIWINEMWAWANNGQEQEFKTTSVLDVQILQEFNSDGTSASSGTVATVSSDGNTWFVRGVGQGSAKVRVQYRKLDGSTDEKDYNVVIRGKSYYLEIMSSDIDSSMSMLNMLANDRKEVQLGLNSTSYAENGEEKYGPVEDATFTAKSQDTSVADVSVEGNILTILGKEKGQAEIQIEAKAEGETEEGSLWVYVTEEYMTIEPAELPEQSTLKVGDVLDANALGLKVHSHSADGVKEVSDVSFCFLGYNPWLWKDVSEEEDGSVTKLMRLNSGNPYIYVSARKKNDEGEWEVLCGREYTFEEQDCGVTLEGMRDANWSWMFADEEHMLTLNPGTLADKDYTVEWSVGQYGNENFVEADSSAYTVNGDSITLHGSVLKDMYPCDEQDNPFRVRATLSIGDIPVAGVEYDVRVWTPECRYDFPVTNPGENDLLPGENIWISGTMSGWVQDKDHPYGVDGFQVTGLKITAQGTWDDDGNEIPLKDGEEDRVSLNDNGEDWNVRAENYGWAQMEMTYLDADNVEKTYEFTVYVHGETYRLDFLYPDDSNRMPYQGQLVVESSLRLDRDGEASEDVENYRLVLNGSYDTKALDVSVSDDGKGVVIKSKQNYDHNEGICFDVQVLENGRYQTVCSTMLYVEVRDSYYVIRFANMPEDGIHKHIGEVLDINELEPQIYLCDTETPDGVAVTDDPDLRITLIRDENDEKGWDENTWQVVEGEESKKIPRLERIGDWGSGINIFLEKQEDDEHWYEQCRIWLEIPDLEYRAEFADLRGGDHTWVFNDEDLTLMLDTQNLPFEKDNVTVEWQIGTWNDETGDDDIIDNNGEYDIIQDNVNGKLGITLHGAKLAETYSGDSRWCNLNGIIKVNGIEVWQVGTGVEVREPWFDYTYPLSFSGENLMLPGESRSIATKMDCYLEDKNHPDGENVQAEIKAVEILGQGYEWNWDDYRPNDYDISDNGESIITLSGDTQNGWSLHADKGYGFAHVKITYTDPGTKEEAQYDFPVFVGNERYELELTHADGKETMKPNSEKTITTALTRFTYDEESGAIKSEKVKDYNLAVKWDDGNLTYDENLLEVIPNGKTLTVKSNDNEWETDIWVRAMVYNPDTANSEEVVNNRIHVKVEKTQGGENNGGNNGGNNGTTITDGLHKGADGELYYYKNGSIDKTFTGIAKLDGEEYYVSDGKVARVSGLTLIDNAWYYLANGKVDREYVGIAPKYDEWFYVTNGVLDTTFSGLVKYNGGKFVIAAGRLVKEANGLWQDVKDGKWYFLSQGQVQDSYSGLALYDNEWFYVTNGELNISYVGLVLYDGAWFYVNKGQMDTEFVGIVEYNGGKFIVAAGRLVKEANGLWQNPKDGVWYFAANGQIQTQYSGVAMYDGEWFVIKNGKLDSSYNGTIEYDGATFKVVAGQLYV